MKKIKALVIGRSGDKSVRVEWDRYARHPLYSKIIRSRTVVMAHDPLNLHKKGDVVMIVSSRPFSARKAYKIVYNRKEKRHDKAV